MKYILFILFVITTNIASYSQNTMAYYTDLSETIDGEKYISLYTFREKYLYLSREHDRHLSDEEMVRLLKNRNISSRYSTIKLEKNAMLNEKDDAPNVLYPLKALRNINGNLILANIEVKDNYIVARLDSLGQIYVNDKLVAKIKNNYEILNLKGKILARMTKGRVLQDSLNNEIIRINTDGSYIEKGKEKEKIISNKSWTPHRELIPTASALHYLFILKNVININFKKN